LWYSSIKARTANKAYIGAFVQTTTTTRVVESHCQYFNTFSHLANGLKNQIIIEQYPIFLKYMLSGASRLSIGV
jgi:hypothetical protein